jgi:hypothetical protein
LSLALHIYYCLKACLVAVGFFTYVQVYFNHCLKKKKEIPENFFFSFGFRLKRNCVCHPEPEQFFSCKESRAVEKKHLKAGCKSYTGM